MLFRTSAFRSKTVRLAQLSASLAALTLLASFQPAGAADPKGAKSPAAAPAEEIPQVPGGDLFGFTSATDVGDPGGKGIGLETTTRIGKSGGGTFVVPTLKTQFGWTVAEDFSIAASPFLTGVNINGVPGVEDKSFIGFDGLSAEASYRILKRAVNNPWAITLSTEARWARIDGATGAATDGRAITLKAFVDRPIIAGKLSAAFNANLTTGTSRLKHTPGAEWADASGSDLSAALTWQASEALFFGAETHWLESFSGSTLDTWQGRAITIGPTALWKVSESVAINFGWQAQVSGHATGSGKPLDLTNFDRHAVRLKLAIALP
jgi:hypothetical protein